MAYNEPPEVPEHVLAQAPQMDCLDPKFATTARKVTAEFLKIAAAPPGEFDVGDQWKKVKQSHVHVIHHETRPALKGLVSARDSVDVVTVGRFDDGRHYFVAASSVDDPSAPPQKGRTRTWQYPVGYVIRPKADAENQSSFTMVFHSDLKLGTLGGMVAGMAAPTLMLQKAVALKSAVKEIDVKGEDLDHGDVPVHQLDQWLMGA